MVELRVGPINAATPTPLTPAGALDRASALRLCRRWVDIGLDGVFVLGSMGEGTLLSDDVRNGFVELALEQAGDKLTVFVGAADLSRARMAERALRYARMGAHCIVLCVPPGRSPASAISDVKSVADACPAPCAYYEVPLMTGTALVADEILDLCAHPNIRVLKDSSDNSIIAHGITAPERRPQHCLLLDGCEYRTVFSQAMGYDGVLHGGGVMTGRWVREVWRKAEEGLTAEALQLDRSRAIFLAQLYNRFARPFQSQAAQKYALKLLGILDHDTVLADQKLDDAARARIAAAIAAHPSALL